MRRQDRPHRQLALKAAVEKVTDQGYVNVKD
jgi:hypothetical protein